MHVIWNSNGAEKNKYKNIACKIILYMNEMFSTSLKKTQKTHKPNSDNSEFQMQKPVNSLQSLT